MFSRQEFFGREEPRGNFKFFLGNKIERLFEQLKRELFSSSEPFARRLLIVPNPAIKSWLLLQMAQDPEMQIAAGIEIIYLPLALEKLNRLFLVESEAIAVKSIPSFLDLVLAIEVEIKNKLITFFTACELDQTIWKPVFDYLKVINPEKLSRKSEKRLIALSEKLAHLFIKYGCFAGEMVKEWEKGESLDWQKHLWQTLFQEESPWTYPYKELQRRSCSLESFNEKNLQVHLFAISFLPKLHYQFFSKISAVLPLHYYLLSPCRAFWLDIRSDWETQSLQRLLKKQGVSENKQMALEEFLRDRNPLLANFGRLGREMATQIEDSQVQTEEDYEIPSCALSYPQYTDLMDELVSTDQKEAPLSILAAVQADMLLLRNPDQDQIDFPLVDNTIHFHVASSRMREVEILYNQLLSVISKHANDDSPICPSDIIVMAPDIMLYEAYIKAIFGHRESHLDYQLMDLQAATQSSLVQGFLYLLELPGTRWDASSLMQLFDYPEFQRKHRLSKEEVQQIRLWVKDLGIYWGDDHVHRNELLQRSHCAQEMVEESSIGTWEYGLSRLLLGLTMVLERGLESSSLLKILPFGNVDLTHGELVGKLIHLLRSLREDLKPLNDGTELSLNDWTDYLTCLYEAYFDLNGKEDLSQNGFEALKKQINLFRLSSQKFAETTFCFMTIKCHLASLLSQESLCYRENHLQSVRFCSMLPMRAMPAKVIYLLGMSEEAFPKKEFKLSLNLMQGNQLCDYCPSSIDYDRFLFLEILLSARHYFILSYVSGGNTEQHPSLLISELIDYLDKAYRIQERKASEMCVTHHPFYSFDRKYFERDTQLNNYSFTDYLAAKAFYQTEKKSVQHFLPGFFQKDLSKKTIPSMPAEVFYVNLKQLSDLARNPLKAYFNRTLGIYLPSSIDRELKSEESFELSALDQALFRKFAVNGSIDHVVALAEKEGILPLGAFKKMAQERLTATMQETQNHLACMGVNVDQIFQIDFSQHCQQPAQQSENHWLVPAIEINYEQGIKVKIIGRLSNVTPQGLIVHGKNDPSDIAKAWPHYLMLNYLSFQAIDKQLLLTKHDKPKERVAIDHEALMESYVRYYFSSLEKVSCLLPEWIPDFLCSDSAAFQLKVSQSLNDKFNPIYNDYLSWLLNHSDLQKEITHFDYWRDQANSLFGDSMRVWFPKLKKKEKN